MRACNYGYPVDGGLLDLIGLQVSVIDSGERSGGRCCGPQIRGRGIGSCGSYRLRERDCGCREVGRAGPHANVSVRGGGTLVCDGGGFPCVDGGVGRWVWTGGGERHGSCEAVMDVGLMLLEWKFSWHVGVGVSLFGSLGLYA